MLEPILCGPLSWAPLLPKLRGHFAEFLNNASPAGLRILYSSPCVGLRYGYCIHYSGFSRHYVCVLRYFYFAPHHAIDLLSGFANLTSPALAPVSPFPAYSFLMRPHSSDKQKYRNFHLLSIDYVFRPRLRSRLTQSRSALLWKPWIFGLEDSHLHLATHSGILSSHQSTAPYRYSFCSMTMLLYHSASAESAASVLCFSPGHFRRRTSRLESYYALFECMAASEPTS